MRDGHRRSFFRRFVSILACVVVFCTTYALLLPAITLEKTAACGIEEHQHDDSCYENKLTCGLKETEGHSHTEDCYDIHSQIICKIEEHAHTGACFDKNGNLTCALEEHTHDSGCFREDRVLSCKKEEAEPHHHSDACYEKVLTCLKDIHTHSAACYPVKGEAEVSVSEEADVYSTEEAESPVLDDNDIPPLFQQMLTDATSLYTLSGDKPSEDMLSGNEEEDEEAVWTRVDENDIAEVHATDIVRLYYAYTIPEGTLDASNSEFRLSLPPNVYLTDEQIETNNAMNDGRGAQALEGTRTPDEAPTDPEGVSAWVTFENVYEDIDDDTYEDIEAKSPSLLEQDVVLTFDEYSIEKNRKTYDNDGALISDGEKINGFFSIDVTADQIQFDQNDENLEAQITLVEKDSELDIEPICRTLRLVEEDATEEEVSEEEVLEEKELEAEEAEGEKTEEETISEAGNNPEEAAEKETESGPEEEKEEEKEEKTGKDLEDITEAEAESNSEEEMEAEAGSNSEGELEEAEAESISKEKLEEAEEKSEETSETDILVFKGPDYTVTATYTEDAGIPAGASLVVQEITEETEGFDYEDYCAQAEEAIAQKTAESTSWIRLFDISIVTQYGEKLDPQDAVSVQITYRETPAQRETDRLRTVHFAGKEETPQVIGDTSQPIAEPLDQVNFKTNSFSVFAIVGTTIEKTVLASDGHNYKVSVSYGIEADIPDDVKLEVEEILPGNKKGLEDGIDSSSFYDEYIAKTENALGWEAGSASYARVFDISIVKGEEKVQPAEGTKVDVRIELADAKEQHKLNVVHFADDRDEGDVVANSTENEQKGAVVEFPAEGFSVYVIADHEGGDIITPRVEFHFLDSDYTEVSEGTGYTYSAEPYSFVNKAGEYQTTQILKDGEGLEQITNPRNKTDPDRYFYGWYVVDSNSNPDESPVVYTWTEDPVRIIEETPISISIDGTMVTWTLGEASGSGIVDEDGCIHVYLAPIYEDYYFVNFHIGPKEDLGTEEQPGLAHSLMTRKLIVLGSDGETNVRIGNVQAPSPDAVHKIFAGWETVKSEGGNLITERIYPTIDLEGNEISNPEGEDGYYINVTEEKDIDLYPVYAEARWVYFHTGESGNGATYVGAKYLLTSDDIQPGEVNPYYFETLPVSQRNGYNFDGWYIDKDGEENGTGDRITDENGNLVDNFVKYDTDGTTKLYEIVDGKLYFYKAMTDLHLYAKWEEVEDSSFNVIIWRQKVTDNKNAADEEKTYDYVDSETIACNSGLTLQQVINSGKLSNYIANGVNGKYTGFTYRTTDMSTETVKGDKTTVVNVYYDRNLMTINWRNGNNAQNVPAYVYTETDANSGELYGWVNGQYVPLTVSQGSDYHTYTYSPTYSATAETGNETYYGIVDGQYVQLAAEPQYAYSFGYNRFDETTSDNGAQYALVEGEYVDLTRVDDSTYTWTPRYAYTGSNNADQTMFGVVNGSYVSLTREQTRFYVTSTNEAWPGTRYAQATDNTVTQYGIVGGQLVQLTRSGSLISGYSWSYNGQAYTGTRYKESTANNNTYAFVNGQMLGVTRAGSNFYYYSYNGEVYSTYRNNTTYGGTRYTRSNYSGPALPEGTVRYKMNGSAYTAATDNEGTQYYYDGTGYVELVRNGNTSFYWQYLNDGNNVMLSDSDTRYVYSNNSSDYTRQRLTRSGSNWWNYTYTATDAETEDLYGIDDRGGHVPLGRSQTVAGYKYYYNGEEYTKTRYIKNDTLTAYTGTRYLDAGGTAPVTEHGSGQYGKDANGVFVELDYSSGPTYFWTYTDEEGVSHTYTGKRYTRTTQNISSFTGLYGQKLEQNGYTWPSSYTWYSGTNSSGSRLTFLDAFLFEGLSGVSSNNTVLTLYRGNTQSGGSVNFYKQNLDGSWPSESVNSVQTSGGNFSITDKYAGFTAYQYKTGNYSETGWITLGTPSGGSYASVSSANSLRIRFRRNSYTLTFDTNYPYDTVIYFDSEQWTPGDYSGDIEGTRDKNLLYEASLAEYGSTGSDYWVPKAPDHYIFDGWYEDATCTVPFNFNSTMPAANKVVYAKWTPETFRVHINPNGAEIDHINHNGTPTFRADLNYYYDDKATYINADYGTSVVEYTLDREYVPISDAVAQTMDPNAVYYYIYSPYYENTGRGLPADLRNALYVTENELDSYYQYYVDLITALKASNPERYNEVTILGPAAWRNDYVSTQKYRKKYANERYEFLGWFKDDETMPYNFSDPVEESFTLTAHWRLDGGYSVMYTPEFIMPDGTLINGNIESLQDPQGDAAYADQATTTILHQPTALTANGAPVEDDSYIFRGWRLVSIGGTPENPIYVPLEENKYYQEGDVFTIEAKNANPSGIIYLQAVYEEKDSSYRRPEIANLILDANSGFITTDGETELGANQNLDRIGDVGTVALDAAEDQIIFGDLQSNIAVHVDDYAVDPNYFKHPNGYFLLGFDDEPDEKDYVATYAADSIISVSRTDEETIYAVWEPMVYINFVNNTEVDDVTFGISSEDSNALYVVNLASGTHERVSLTDLGNITVKKGETIRLAVPYGAEKNITISGTNTLGAGQVLYVDSTITGDFSDQGRFTDPSQVMADNGQVFAISDRMVVDSTGITVTFTADQHDRTLILDDNYEGGNTQEIYFSNSEIASATTTLPSTSTRFGYELKGWAVSKERADSGIKDYDPGFVLGGLDSFFGDELIKTLYAVWEAKSEASTVYIYKTVPKPGSQSQQFQYNVAVSGTHTRTGYTQKGNVSASGTFILKSGEYAKLYTEAFLGSSDLEAYLRITITVYDTKGNVDGNKVITASTSYGSGNRRQGSFNSTENISVQEEAALNYDPSVEIAATTVDTLNKTIHAEGNDKVTWEDTFAGGTVIYTNNRQPSDITVKKNLVGNIAAGAFSYSASYTLDDVTTDLGTFTVSSTSETGYILEKIPVGAVLTITEAEDNSYEVSTAFENGSTDTDNASNIVSFNVPNGGETVTYTNTLKSYPVKIVKVNQDGEADLEHGNGVEARFDMSQDGSNIVSGKYTTPTDNVIYDSAHDGNLYVGTYTLTETWTQPGYLGLNAPVTLTLRGDGTLTSDTSEAVVTGNETEGFVVSVINRATKNVTVRKILKDPLVSQRTFKFTASYTIGNVTEAFPDFSILSSNDLSGTHILTVPVGATLDVTEDSTGLTDVYTTQVAVEGENSTTSNTITINNVQNTAELTFTNTRKTAQITVVKQMSDETDELSFPFTAILKNGATPIEQYLVYTVTEGGNEIEHKTDHSGQVPFELSHGQSQVLTVPAGAVLVLSETTNDYIADITSTTGASDADSEDNSFTLTVSGDDRITFLNQPKGASVLLRKIGYDNRDESSWNLQGATFKIYTDSDKSNGSLVTLDGRSEFTSDEDGLLYEGIIPAGTYYLDETNVPAGYNNPPGMYVLTVSNGIVTLNSTVTIGTPDLNHWITSETDPVTGKTTYIVSIRNTTGVVLPSTGGLGTDLIYLLGIILTSLAGLGLVMRKRRRAI